MPPGFNDARTIFADRNLSEEQLQKLDECFRAKCDLHPFPTKEQVSRASGRLYYYGYYVTDAEIYEYAVRHYSERIKCPEVTVHDMVFFQYSLSEIMAEDYVVTLKCGYVSEEHKRKMPEMEENVGDTALLVVLLTTEDWRFGYHPSNREIYELNLLLGRKPCWWEPVDHAFWG